VKFNNKKLNQLIFDKGAKAIPWEKVILSTMVATIAQTNE
jgi:hypothetical protein